MNKQQKIRKMETLKKQKNYWSKELEKLPHFTNGEMLEKLTESYNLQILEISKEMEKIEGNGN